MSIKQLPFTCINKNLELYTDSIGYGPTQLETLRQLLEQQKQAQVSYNKELRDTVMHQIDKEMQMIQQRIGAISFQIPTYFRYPNGKYCTEQTISNRASTKLCFEDALPHRFQEHEAMSYECDMRIHHRRHQDVYTRISICDNMLYLVPYDNIDRMNTIRYLYIDNITTGTQKGKGYAKDLAAITSYIAQANNCDLIASHLHPSDTESAEKIYSGKYKQGFIIKGSFCYKILTFKGQSFIDGSFFD